MSKYELRDKSGRKIGTVEEKPTAVENAVFVAAAVHHFKEPLAFLMVPVMIFAFVSGLLFVAMGVLAGGLEFIYVKFQNSYLEEQYAEEISAVLVLQRGLPMVS